jgi:hypothetical protein
MLSLERFRQHTLESDVTAASLRYLALIVSLDLFSGRGCICEPIMTL